MRKILLDLGIPKTKEEVHSYIAERMGFPEYYGKNLDALYDELGALTEPTAVGIFLPVLEMDELDFELMLYLDRVGKVFSDAEQDNPSLAVIFGDLPANPEYEELYDGDEEDRYLKPDADGGWPVEDSEDEADDPVPGEDSVLVLDIGGK